MSRDERGQVLALMSVTCVGLLVLVGVVVDAGLLFAARRDLQSSADAAARAGAMEIDVALYRSSGGARVALEPESAETHALALVEDGVDARAEASSEAVEVTVARPQPLLLLRVIGIDDVKVEATARARPRTGIQGPWVR